MAAIGDGASGGEYTEERPGNIEGRFYFKVNVFSYDSGNFKLHWLLLCSANLRSKMQV
jgi:hypothetical protein